MSLKITALAKIPKLQLPEKLKGTIVERWLNYWKTLARDYKEVATDSGKFMKANPVRSAIYGAIGGFAFGCCKTNPDSQSYTDQLKIAQNEISLIYFESQNPASIEYLKYLETCRNNETIRIMSLGFFSIVWIDDKSFQLATPDAQCKYLQPAYATFHERIIDWGFWNKWWTLHKHMKDYDVNY